MCIQPAAKPTSKPASKPRKQERQLSKAASELARHHGTTRAEKGKGKGNGKRKGKARQRGEANGAANGEAKHVLAGKKTSLFGTNGVVPVLDLGGAEHAALCAPVLRRLPRRHSARRYAQQGEEGRESERALERRV